VFHRLPALGHVDAEQVELSAEPPGGQSQRQTPTGHQVGNDGLLDDHPQRMERQQQR
jgi:hypothetical protein